MPDIQQFNAYHPAPGVKVLPAGMAHNHLPLTQARNARLVDDHISWHVLKSTMRCEAVGLGIPSTIRTVRSPKQPIVLKGCYPGTVTPSTRRRGHKRKPANPGFSNPILGSNQMRMRAFPSLWESLKGQHMRLISYKGKNPDISVETRYEAKRARIIRTYQGIVPNLVAQIDAMEENHIRLCGK